MRIRSVDALEDELKTFLTNPHTSSNMKNAVSMAEKILEVKKDSNYALYTMALHEVCVANKVAPMADYSKAIENFENIIKVDPKFIEAYLMLAKVYRETDRQKEYELLLKANKVFPDHYLIMFDLANLMCFKTGEKEKGLELFTKCVQKLPQVDTAWAALGSAYLLNRNLEMAIKCFETSLAINPENLTSMLGVGVYYFEHADFKKAREYYEKSLMINKDSFWATFNISLLDLLEGDYENGLRVYEKRNKDIFLKKYGGCQYPEITRDEVQKNTNEKIVVLREQGFGDDVMFSRYLKPFKDLGYDVNYACPPELIEFFKLSPDLDGINVSSHIAPDQYSYRTFLMSLPWITSKFIKNKINKPISIDWKRFDEKKIKISAKTKSLLNSDKLKVGFAWSGRPTHLRDQVRTMDINYFENLFNSKDVNFFSLQKFGKKEDLKYMSKFNNVYDCENDLKDFLHTAYLIKHMDVIFTIDTSLVHLAGTLNKKTFLFLPLVPDYRWGLKNKQEWYPEVNLLRQKKIDDWTHPVKEAKKVLEKLSS